METPHPYFNGTVTTFNGEPMGEAAGLYVKVMTDEQMEVLRRQISVYATLCEQLVEMHKAFTAHNDSVAGMRQGNLYFDLMVTSGGHKITARQRWTPTPVQLQILENIFDQGTGTPSKQKIKEITHELSQHGQISETNVYNWFQNRRARSKRKQTTLPDNTESEAEAENETPSEKKAKSEKRTSTENMSQSGDDPSFYNTELSSELGDYTGQDPKRTPCQMLYYDNILPNPRIDDFMGKMEGIALSIPNLFQTLNLLAFTAMVTKTPMADVKSKKATKKPSAPKKPRSSPSHPTYHEMIGEAIGSLKERTGSSQYAIAKFIEDKHKANLPPNFKKLLLLQLKKLTASGKLAKVKNSFKLAAAKPASKPKAATKPKEKAVAKPKAKAAAKPKAKAAEKPKAKAAAPKPKSKAKAALKVKSPARAKPKAKSVKTAALAKKVTKSKAAAAPAKKAVKRKVKSVNKSPAKKAKK